jgi:hypothetical protein
MHTPSDVSRFPDELLDSGQTLTRDRLPSMQGRSLVALGLLVGLVVPGCRQKEPLPPSVLTGVITEISTGTGGEVTGFELGAVGKAYRILIDPERDYGFDLTHLYEHQTTGDPVRVRLQQRDDALYALRIDDA